jgi:hypothetical protein
MPLNPLGVILKPDGNCIKETEGALMAINGDVGFDVLFPESAGFGMCIHLKKTYSYTIASYSRYNCLKGLYPKDKI